MDWADKRLFVVSEDTFEAIAEIGNFTRGCLDSERYRDFVNRGDVVQVVV